MRRAGARALFLVTLLIPLGCGDSGEEVAPEGRASVVFDIDETLRRLETGEDRVFLHGYGDSTTGFAAYNQAGIPVPQTFAHLRRGEVTCQDGSYGSCRPGHTDHLATIEGLPDR